MKIKIKQKGSDHSSEVWNMNTLFIRSLVYLQLLIEDEQGQDLVEYALVVALIAFGAINGMGFLAKGLNRAFSNIAVTLTSNI